MPNQEAQKKRERHTFELFLKAYPALAAKVDEDKWDVNEERRHGENGDISCWMKDGSRVDYQLAAWLDPEQTRNSKTREEAEKAILSKLLSCFPKPLQNLHSVFLSPQPKISSPNDRELSLLAKEFGELMDEVSAELPQDPEWQPAQGYPWRDFDKKKYKIVGKYISEAIFNFLTPISQWIVFESPGGCYDPLDAFNTLIKRLEDKASHYGKVEGAFDLVLHYSDAYLYNTPYRGIQTPTFEDVARKVSKGIQEHQYAMNRNQFRYMYLLNELGPDPQAFCIYPKFNPCA